MIIQSIDSITIDVYNGNDNMKMFYFLFVYKLVKFMKKSFCFELHLFILDIVNSSLEISMKQVIIDIENVSNEIFYEIFDYLDGDDYFVHHHFYSNFVFVKQTINN